MSLKKEDVKEDFQKRKRVYADKLTSSASKTKPCKCGYNRWKTIEKDILYECRKCGERREDGKRRILVVE